MAERERERGTSRRAGEANLAARGAALALEGCASRREVLRGALVLGAALAGCRTARPSARPIADPVPAEPVLRAAAPAPRAPRAPSSALLSAPDLSDARVMRFVAGLRPYRRGGARLALEALGERSLVHDYGHGGAGLTLAFGCAQEVVELVLARHAPPEPVCVLGAGISGLACARALAERGFRVRVLARELPPHTTSDLAGGQWAPSLIDPGDDPARFERWIRRSHAAYAALVGPKYGVYPRENYATHGAGAGLRAIPAGLFAPPRRLARLPFPGRARPGLVFDTFLIEPPRLLPALMRDLDRARVAFEQAELASRDDALALPERVLVDALGLGARDVFGDPALVALRGQLVLCEPQPLGYLLSHEGYLFPRSDALVLGGTVEPGELPPRPDPADCRAILETHRRFFA